MRMICINCPKGCVLDVESKDGEITVTGNGCAKGIEYGRAELADPRRVVTGLVRVAGLRRPLSVKTKTAVPKGKIAEVLSAINRITVPLPVMIGDTILRDIAGTGVDLVATANYGA